MELRHLRYFAVLARELHFARAAEQLGITQPTLSRTIQHLEKELGVHLFSRENKWNISLTEAGRTLLAETEKILPKLDDAMTRTRAVGSGICGRLTVGAISSMIGHPAFIDTLAQMQKNVPRAVIEIVDSTSGELQEMLAERSVDVALMRLAKPAEEAHHDVISVLRCQQTETYTCAIFIIISNGEAKDDVVPLTGGDAWDVSSDQVVASILPGGEKHDYFMTCISIILREQFDYTKWQREYYDAMKPGEFMKNAAEYARLHPFEGQARRVRIEQGEP